MTSRERLEATLSGAPVDRPPVSFYEVGGCGITTSNEDPFNIYSDPSWRPLLDLAEARTDLIRMRGPGLTPAANNCAGDFIETETREEGASRFTRTRVTVGGRTLTSLRRRDRDVYTVWTLEHLIKSAEDARAWLELPDEVFAYRVDMSGVHEEDAHLGPRGIVMVDSPDPLCVAADLFSMEDYVVIAATEPALFHEILEKVARWLYPRTADIAAACPGFLWRICGPEYATEPYLSPAHFRDYVVWYTGPMVETIQGRGGRVRLHCHGRLRNVLPLIAEMGVDATDPVEPPPQGDVELEEVRREYGRDIALFGNVEVSDIETMDPAAFRAKVERTVAEGTAGPGRGFCLMPTAAPYGRTIAPHVLENYHAMLDAVGA